MKGKKKSAAKKEDDKARFIISRDFDTPEQIGEAIALFYAYVMKKKQKPRGTFFIKKGRDKRGKDVPVIEKFQGEKK